MSSGRDIFKFKSLLHYLIMNSNKLIQLFFKLKIILYFILYSFIWYIVLSIPIYSNKYFGNLVTTIISHINHALFIPSIVITNIILNFPSIKIFDYVFWNSPNLSLKLILLYCSIQGFITTLFIVNFSKQEYRRKILIFLSIFYILLIITRFYLEFNHFNDLISLSDSEGIKVGKGGLITFIDTFFPVAIATALVYYSSIKLNYKSLRINLLKFSFLFAEVFITIFISFIFINTKLDTGATNYDLFFHYVYILILGFFLFLLIQIFRDFLKKKLKGFD